MVSIYSIEPSKLIIDEREVLRYLGYKRDLITEEDISMVRDYTKEVRAILSPKACYEKYPVEVSADGLIKMPYGEIVSKNLTMNLLGCKEIYMFAATIGPRFDMALIRARAVSISKAAVFQSIGAAAVEEVCDSLNAMIDDLELQAGNKTRPRYSPGFGDMTLDNQKGVFSVLRPEKHIGVTLKDNLIMAPEKSVTAIIGVE